MTSEEYGQYIDDFELGADVMPGESLTEYIERRRREFESKADGGVIGIEVKIADEMAKGGRVGLLSGGALKGLASLFKAGKDKIADFAEIQANKKIFKSADEIPPMTISKAEGPMTIEMMEAVDPSIVKKLLRTQELGLYEETPEILKAANLLERFTKKVKGKRVIDYERAEAILGVPLKGDETINDLFKIEFETRPENRLADGGRVGLFMGGPALEGQALQIYNSMKGYNFSDQEIADALSARGLYTPAGSGTTTTAPEGIIGAQLNQDRDDGPKGDFGLFGDLLKDTEKTFTKNVYTEIAPNKFDFVPTQVTGYKNVKTGNYQTEAGKNINHLGLEIPTIAGMLFDKNFGKGPQVGDIEGTFTKGIPAGMKNFFNNPLNIFKKQQATIADINAMNKKAYDDLQAKLAAEKAAKEAARAAEMARYNITSDSDFGGGVPGGGGGNVRTTGGDVYGGAAYGYNEAAEKTDYYRDGGLATMFTRRR